MNMLKVISFGILLASTVSVAGYAKTQKAGPNAAEGSITLSEKEEGGGVNCTIPFASGQYTMSSTPGCKENVMNFFRLNGVPSAARVEFNSEFDCRVSDWRYTVRTFIEPTTTRFISIPDELRYASVGDILVKGVRMEQSYYDHGNVKGKLSCILIYKSDLVTP